jgi:hypothetical protein
MNGERDKLWYLLKDQEVQVTQREVRLDVLDALIDDERRLQYQQTGAQLQRINFNVSNYLPPPRRLRSEQRSAHHVGPGDDVEALVRAAQESPLDRAHRDAGRILSVR